MKQQPLTIQAVHDWLDGIAPFDTQEEFDNSGLQVGLLSQQVTGILLCLDVTEEVVREAAQLGANLIIAHHPLLFVPQRDLNLARHAPQVLAALLRRDIALLAAHTNLDKSAQYSASLAVCHLLGLRDIRRAGDYLFLGELERPLEGEGLRLLISQALAVPARLYGEGGRRISTLAVAGGAYSEGFQEAIGAGAQALLTGEVRHHHAVEAAQTGMLLVDGGHFATEQPMLEPLALGLQSMANGLQCSVRVHVSRVQPYRLQ